LIGLSSLSIKKNQKGIVLLMLVVVLAFAISTYYFSTISVTGIHVDNIEKTRKILKRAKSDLLAYAMNYTDTAAGLGNTLQGPGNFPCPDDTMDGYSNTGVGVVVPGCGSFGAGTMGRFPWATIQTDEYKDMSGELLWYAISSNFANQANKDINTATTGEITVRNSSGSVRYDATAIDGIVAVIIAPGQNIKRDDGLVQSRSTAAEMDNPKNYLDIASGEDNASFTNGDLDGFIMGEVRDSGEVIVNDLMIVITYSEIMALVHARVAEVISGLVNDYFSSCDAYPEASAFDPTKGSFDSEGTASPNELREGHLPLDTALPVDWGVGCAPVLPAWLDAESWHKTSYYAFAYQNAPPVNSDTCGNGTNPACMTVNSTVSPVNDAQALIIFSGRDLTGNRPSALMSDYFEAENNDLDSVYDADETEDYIRVITP